MTEHRASKATRRGRFSMRRLLIGLLAFAAAVGTTGGLALAYWTSSGSGTATATTGNLTAPQGVTGSSTAGTGTVSVSWTASTGTSAPRYYITRTDSSNVSSPACGTSSASTTNNTTCSDSTVPLGTYTYRVIAVYHNWTTPSAPSSAVTVARASQTITFTSTPGAPTLGGSYTVTATGGDSGNPVTFGTTTPAVCTVSGSVVSFVHAGSCTVTADQAASTYFFAAAQAEQSITVGKATQTIMFTSTAPANAVVGGSGYTATATGGASSKPVTFTIDAATSSNCSIAASVVTYQHVGTCIVDANQAGNGDYLAASQVQQSIAVGQGSQAISYTSTPPSSAQVGGTYLVSATSSSGLTVAIALDASSSGCSLSGSTVTFTGAGTCVVDAKQAGDADYLPAGQMQQSFPISRLNQTINFTSTAPSVATFGDAPYTAAATATSGLTVAFTSATPAVCTSTGTNGATITLVAAGSCTVSANQAGNGTYNPAPQVQQTFSIAKANQTLSFTSTAPPGATVGGATYTASATATSGLTVTFSSATTSMCTSSGTNGATITFVGAGTCTVNADQSGNANYNSAPTKPQTFSVGKGSQTITFTSTAPANAAAGGATYTVAATGGASTSPVTFASATTTVCTVSGSTVTFGAAGTCTINANQVGDANYNAAAQKQQSFPVAAAAPTVSDVTMHNGAGSAVGKVEANDTLTIQYSAQMKASTFCSTWTGGTGDLSNNGQVTVTIANNGGNDTLSVITTSGCTFNLGSVSLGADYVSATVSFNGTGSNRSIVSLNSSGLLTITLGAPSTLASLRIGVAASNPVYTPASGLTDAAGTALATTPFTDPDPSRF